MDKRDLLAKAFHPFIFDKINKGFIYNHRRQGSLICLAYHRVLDINNESEYPYDVELNSASVANFEQQIEYISKYFTPITLKALLGHRKEGKHLPNRAVLVTFDDGFEDNYLNAFPILERYDVPATIFISTGYMGTNKSFWFEHLANTILCTSKQKLSIPSLNIEYELGMPLGSRRVIVAEVLDALKDLSNNERLKTIEYLTAHYRNAENSATSSLSRPLSWEQIGVMCESCIEIGSHTVNHPVLSMLSESELIFELTKSKNDLEEHINKPVEAIAYPVGGAFAYNSTVENAAKNAGYIAGFNYINQIAKWPLNKFTINRLSVERYTTFERFEGILNFPSIFSY